MLNQLIIYSIIKQRFSFGLFEHSTVKNIFGEDLEYKTMEISTKNVKEEATRTVDYKTFGICFSVFYFRYLF
jgi:hypothetical protein